MVRTVIYGVLDVLLMKCTVELEFIIICDIVIFHLNETK